MASGVNKVILLGTLGQTPEVKYLGSGQAVCSFSIATNESWLDKQGQRQEKCEWHKIVVWGKLAELCGQYLDKGRQVYLEGKIQSRKYEKDGVERTAFEIVARDVTFLGGKSDGQGQQPNAAPYSQQQPAQQQPSQGRRDNLGYGFEPGADSDDVPF